MNQAIIIHGTPSKEEYFSSELPSASNSHWLPWLQKQLLIRNIAAYTPEIPESYQPKYSLWNQQLERYRLDRDTALIGHSCGAGFLLRWLSENTDICIDKLVLAAPWMDPKQRKTTDFFQFKLDSDLIDRTSGVHVLYSTDDDQEILDSTAAICSQLPAAVIHQFENKGHFTETDLNSKQFPELLTLLTEDN